MRLNISKPIVFFDSWDLLNYHGILSSVKPSVLMKGTAVRNEITKIRTRKNIFFFTFFSVHYVIVNIGVDVSSFSKLVRQKFDNVEESAVVGSSPSTYVNCDTCR